MQRLDAAVHDLGKAGELGDLRDRHAARADSAAVPPVESSATPRCVQRLREFDETVLLETLSSARRTFGLASRSARQAVVFSFLRSVPRLMPSIVGRAALVALGIVEHGPEQRLFHFAQHQVVELAGRGRSGWRSRSERLLGVVAQRQGAGAGLALRAAYDELVGAIFFTQPRSVSARLRRSGCVVRRLPRVLEA